MIGRKDDMGKLRWDLVDYDQLEKMVKVLTFGANKYGDNNWRDVQNPINRYFAAALRHLIAYRKGEKIDKESGIEHLAHAFANLMFLLYLEETKK